MSEVDRLRSLGSVDAILDELQQNRTKWDDAREALDALISAERAEVERLRGQLQKSDCDLVGAHNDLCEAVGVRRVTLAGAIQHAATVRAERDRLAEENDRLRADVEAAKRGWRKDVDRVEHTRALLPEIDGTFRRLCERLSTEDQEALAEVYTALKRNLHADPGA